MNTKKIYVHIGMPKTGSSAIQAFFAINAKQLTDHNYSFPWHPGFGQSFQTSAGNATNLHHWILDGEYTKFEDAVKSIKEDNIILSSEILFHTVRLHPERFYEAIKNFDFKIICYVRKIDDLVNSCVNQLVKNHNLKNYDELNNIIDDHDFSTTIINLLKYVDVKKLDVRVYDKTQFVNGTIFSDFLEATNLLELMPESSFTPPEKVINPSLSPEAFELRRLLNFINFDTINSVEKYEMNGILAQYSVLNKEGKNRTILSGAERKKTIKLYQKRIDDLIAYYPKLSFGQARHYKDSDVSDSGVQGVLHFLLSKSTKFFVQLLDRLVNISDISEESERLKRLVVSILIEVEDQAYNKYAPLLYKQLKVILPYNFRFLTHRYSEDLAIEPSKKTQKLISIGDDPYFSIKKISVNNKYDLLIKICMVAEVSSVAQLHFQTLEEPSFGNKKFQNKPVVKGYNELFFRLGVKNFNGIFRFDPIMCSGDIELYSIAFLQP